MADEKSQLLPLATSTEIRDAPQYTRRRTTRLLVFIGISLLCFQSFGRLAIDRLPMREAIGSRLPQCAQIDPIVPVHTDDKLHDMDTFISSEKFRNGSVTRLSQAVQIPSMSYDDFGAIGVDKRWEVFYQFEDYLQKAFPTIHDKLKKEVVNTHGLVYTWQGSDHNLKPTLLMAHQDVVPVAESTINAWTHPPFSGFYDGKYVWGRGASDCKNQLMAIMEAVELLLLADFVPKRTVILTFGFDEEASGTEGAGSIAPFVEKRYGKDSIAAIVDEGSGFTTAWGTLFAAPAVAEKGYTDVTITIRMPGGHSSIPPPHTSIGVLSELITVIEEHAYQPRLDDQNPYLATLQCGAAYGADFPSKLKKLLSRRAKHQSCSKSKDQLAEEAAKEGAGYRYLMQTSQAVDIIFGGVKVNALPERVSAIVNHRINIGERPRDAHDKITKLAKHVARKYDLAVHAFDNVEEPSSIMLTHANTTLEPAPVTPTSLHLENTKVLSPWAILSGTTRALYGSDVIMAPGLSTGNTDTRYYWDLTKHIFRFGFGHEEGEEGLGNIHTVNERQSVAAHINAVRWVGMFLRNMDEAQMP